LLENLANKEIAGKLNISERTVKFHVSNLLASTMCGGAPT
jgi:DNA-binding NarL/FixJ family response regulator